MIGGEVVSCRKKVGGGGKPVNVLFCVCVCFNTEMFCVNNAVIVSGEE